MGDEADPINAQEGCSAVLVVVVLSVNPPDDFFHGWNEIGVDGEQFGDDGLEHALGEPLGGLEQRVADQAIGDHNVCDPLEEISPLDKADIVDPRE